MKIMSGKNLTSVVVDSGGTGTTWALVYSDKTIEKFVGKSCHPVHFSVLFFEELETFLAEFISIKVPVYFFGAGMGIAEKKQEMITFLEKLFSEVHVGTDLDGLVESISMDNGAIAIMGTGSILAEISAGNLKQTIGGLGHLLGDEGSAYYFGRLVLEAQENDQLTSAQKEQLINLENKSEFIFNVQEKTSTASLAKLLPFDLFADFHKKNVELFFEKHVDNQISIDKIAIVGSYGFHCRLLIGKLLQNRGIKMVKFIPDPIDVICDKFVKY